MRRAAAPLLLALALSACAQPVQSGGVELHAGAAARLSVLCRWRHGEVGRDACGAADSRAPARVRRIEAPKDALTGSLAVGRPGDLVLENDEIVIVIDALGPGAGFAESGGNVVDAADARVRRDELGQMFTYFGVFPRQAVYEHLVSGVSRDGVATVDVTGHELYETTLKVTTRYALAPGSRALEITTELENSGDKALDPIDLGDAVQWGSAAKIAPGKELDYTGEYAGPWVGGVGKAVAYGLVPIACAADEPCAPKASGAAPVVASHSGTAWTNAMYAQKVPLPPGAKVRYRRALVVAPRGDTVGVANEIAFLGGATPGGLEVALVDARGQPVEAQGGTIDLTPTHRPGAPWTKPMGGLEALSLANDKGAFAGELPPGEYVVTFEGDGRSAQGEARIEITAGAVAKASIVVGPRSALRVRVTEDGGAVPAKIEVFDAATRKLAMRPELTRRGEATLPTPSGRYRVVASRGPAYDLAEATVELAPDATLDVPLALHRVLDTHGFIACDLHQHTAWSADSGVTAAERVVSNVAEGVECAVASEHNQVVDFSGVVKELGLATRFQSISGEELTSDASRIPWGHANVFPLVADPSRPRGGALAVRDRPVRELFAATRELTAGGGAPRPILQVNHPRAQRRIGYFEQFAFDAETGAARVEGFDADFDALEVWSGRHTQDRGRVLVDLWALLRTGHPLTPTASTDTHGIVGQEAGYPRTYIRVADDAPDHLTPRALIEGLRDKRDVVVSNGPFVTLRGAGVDEGGLVSLKTAALELTAHVESAPWVEVTHLRVVAGGVASEPLRVGCPRGCVATRKTARGAVAFDVPIRVVRRPGPKAPRLQTRGDRVEVEIGADTFVTVIVEGERPLEPVLSGDPAEILPFAMTSPIWIDADGDGSALQR